MAELYELMVAEKYLRCPFFEKRVKGMNEFKEIYCKVQNLNKSKIMLEREGAETTKWLNATSFSEWLLRQQILEFIFVENPHVELIKRSHEIVRMISQDEKLFTPAFVDMIWACTREKHEDIVRATFDLL